MRMLRVLAIWAVVVVGSTSTLSAGPMVQIVAFGDSLTDTGNVYAATGGTIPPSPPYFQGRYSNGPVWVEQLANRLGVPVPAPSLLGGTNWAFGGSESGRGTSWKGTPNTSDLVELYVATNAISGHELFTLLIGPNDIFAALTSGQPLDPAVPADNIGWMIETLYAGGGREFLVGNLPPMGQTPWVSSLGIGPQVDALCMAVNTELEGELEDLRSSLPGVTIDELAVDDLFLEALADPAAFGITNTTHPAFDETTGVLVPNPEEYLFWDGVHPTSQVHAILGDRAYVLVVPEPGSIVLLLIGGFVLVLATARRRRR